MRFIVLPTEESAFDTSDTLRRGEKNRLDPSTRQRQYDELKRQAASRRVRRTISGSAGVFEEALTGIEAALEDLKEPGDRLSIVAEPSVRTPGTGATIVDMTEASAENVQRGLKDVAVVKDQPIELIAPDKGSGDAASDGATHRHVPDVAFLTDEDLWHLEAIGLRAARAAGFDGTGVGVDIAVLDTGVEEVPEIVGRIKDTRSLDANAFVTQSLAAPHDTDGHGTQVAGLIAGQRIGVAPGANLHSAILLPEREGLLSRYVLALEWVMANPSFKIVNMSAGQQGFVEGMRLITRIAQRVNTLCVFAIGNDGPGESLSPGNYPEVLSVGASTVDGGVWSKSGGETLEIDGATVTSPMIVAPGAGVMTCLSEEHSIGGYQTWSGTSFAAPIVAGLAALLLEKRPAMTLADLKAELTESAVALSGVGSGRQGAGLAQVPNGLFSA